MSLLDDAIAGVRRVLGASGVYPQRVDVQFTGASVKHDPVNDAIVVADYGVIAGADDDASLRGSGSVNFPALGVEARTGNRTMGTRWYVTSNDKPLLGLSFAFAATAPRTVRAKLWDYHNGVPAGAPVLIQKDIAVVTGIAQYDLLWDAPFVLTRGKEYVLSIWETSGTEYTYTDINLAARYVPYGRFPFYSPDALITYAYGYDVGDVMPTNNSGAFNLIEPLFAVPPEFE